jgi:hypothetical protein
MRLLDTCNLIQQLYEYNKNKMNDLINKNQLNLETIQDLEKKIVYEISKVNFSEEIKKYDANYNNWKYIDEKDFRNYDLQNDLPVLPVHSNKRAHDPLMPFLANLKPIKTTKQKFSPLKTQRYMSFSNNDAVLFDHMDYLLGSFGGQNQFTLP